MANGVLAGYPMVDVKAKLFMMVHTTMSTHLKLPSRSLHLLALKEAAKTHKSSYLEPMMLVNTVPEENLGDVMGHVTARRTCRWYGSTRYKSFVLTFHC